jgi:hypothetical protein
MKKHPHMCIFSHGKERKEVKKETKCKRLGQDEAGDISKKTEVFWS